MSTAVSDVLGQGQAGHTANCPNGCEVLPQKTFQHVEGFKLPQRRRAAVMPRFASTHPQHRGSEGVHHAVPSMLAQLLPAVGGQDFSPVQVELAR